MEITEHMYAMSEHISGAVLSLLLQLLGIITFRGIILIFIPISLVIILRQLNTWQTDLNQVKSHSRQAHQNAKMIFDRMESMKTESSSLSKLIRDTNETIIQQDVELECIKANQKTILRTAHDGRQISYRVEEKQEKAEQNLLKTKELIKECSNQIVACVANTAPCACKYEPKSTDEHIPPIPLVPATRRQPTRTPTPDKYGNRQIPIRDSKIPGSANPTGNRSRRRSTQPE